MGKEGSAEFIHLGAARFMDTNDLPLIAMTEAVAADCQH